MNIVLLLLISVCNKIGLDPAKLVKASVVHIALKHTNLSTSTQEKKKSLVKVDAMIDFVFFSWLNTAFTGPPHPNGVLVLWMKWPNSQMTVLIWPGRQDNIYKLACPCILCCPLSPSTRNAWVMAYLYTIIRQTHTSPLTVKKPSI